MKKISMFFVALMSLACVSFFTSCAKDEVIAKVKYEGTVKFIVRGYSIGLSGDNYAPKNVEKNIYTPVQGYKIVLANGKTLITDANGIAQITLEAGEYAIDKIELPYGYYSHYSSSYNYSAKRYEYIVDEDEKETYYFGSLEVYPGHEERVISLFKK